VFGRPFVIAFVLCIALDSAATAAPRVRMGVGGGLNLAELTYQSDLFGFDPKYRPAWSAGLALDVPLGSRLSLASGARYIEYGERTVLAFTDGSGGVFAWFDTHDVYRYVAVPLHLRYHPMGRSGPFVAAGPEVSYLTALWHELGVEYRSYTPGPGPAKTPARPMAQIFENGPGSSERLASLRRWNFALAGGIGWELPVAGHAVAAGVQYTHGLTDLTRSPELKRQTRAIETLLAIYW